MTDCHAIRCSDAAAARYSILCVLIAAEARSYSSLSGVQRHATAPGFTVGFLRTLVSFWQRQRGLCRRMFGLEAGARRLDPSSLTPVGIKPALQKHEASRLKPLLRRYVLFYPLRTLVRGRVSFCSRLSRFISSTTRSSPSMFRKMASSSAKLPSTMRTRSPGCSNGCGSVMVRC